MSRESEIEGECFSLPNGMPKRDLVVDAETEYSWLKEAVDAILDHPDIGAVSFVGSTPVAKHVY